MSGTHRGRTIAVVVSAVVGLVAFTTVVQRLWLDTSTDLATRHYYLHHLKHTDGYFEEALLAPTYNVDRDQALIEYLRTEEGGTRLLEGFVALALGLDDGDDIVFIEASSVGIGIDRAGEYWVAIDGRRAPFKSEHEQLLDSMNFFLTYVKSRTFTVDRFPSLKFQLRLYHRGSDDPMIIGYDRNRLRP